MVLESSSVSLVYAQKDSRSLYQLERVIWQPTNFVGHEWTLEELKMFFNTFFLRVSSTDCNGLIFHDFPVSLPMSNKVFRLLFAYVIS